MRRFFLCGLATVAALSAPAFALRIAPGPGGFNQPTKQKVMQAEVAVVGKVSSIDKETVDLEQFAGGPKVAHTVANVKLETVLFGVKNATHVKIVYVKPGDDQPQPGGGGFPGAKPGRPFQPQPAFAPAVDQEGVFFLAKHPTSAGHYVVAQGMNPLLSTDANYKDELKAVTAMAAAFANPEKALKAEKAEDRLTAALAIALKYRGYQVNNNNPSGMVDETAIPAEETKLILKVLEESDWVKTPDAARLADAIGLMPGSFGIPVALPADGEEPLAARQKAYKAWAEKYAAKFEVKKYTAKPMPAQKDRPQPPIGRPVPLPAPAPGGGIGIGGGIQIDPVPPRILK